MGETGGEGADCARAAPATARARGPFVTLNCAAVPGELIESELFGHEKGSFTGAASRHIGKFEQAHRGTLFLERKSATCRWSCRPSCCASWKRARWERVGGDRPVPVDVRAIVATHRDLDDLVKKGGFRPDLLPPHLCIPAPAASLARARWKNPPLVCAFRGGGGGAERLEAQDLPAGGHLRSCSGIDGPERAELRNVVERLLLLGGNPSGIGATVGTRGLGCFTDQYKRFKAIG